ncbi:hypothetical protein [Psychrobacillus sp. L3]|uniref:hypothetical protein n=1 Tax=Psychrobacillus sp. L3 TaxID=3236891 RepID=UPI0036F1BE00
MKRYYVLISCLLVFLITGCSEQTMTYEGESTNWKVIYKIIQNEKEVKRQSVEIQSIGGIQKSNITFKQTNPRGSGCESYFDYDIEGDKKLIRGCLDEPRLDNKDDSFDVFIAWDGQEEKIDLKKKQAN